MTTELEELARHAGTDLVTSEGATIRNPETREREDAALGVVALDLAFRGVRFPAAPLVDDAKLFAQGWAMAYTPPAEWGAPPKREARLPMRVLGSRFDDAKMVHWSLREPGHYASQLGALGIRRLGEQYAHYFPDALVGKAWGDRDSVLDEHYFPDALEAEGAVRDQHRSRVW